MTAILFVNFLAVYCNEQPRLHSVQTLKLDSGQPVKKDGLSPDSV